MIEIHWGWLPVIFAAGTFFGALVIIVAWSLCSIAGMADDAEKTVVGKE